MVVSILIGCRILVIDHNLRRRKKQKAKCSNWKRVKRYSCKFPDQKCRSYDSWWCWEFFSESIERNKWDWRTFSIPKDIHELHNIFSWQVQRCNQEIDSSIWYWYNHRKCPHRVGLIFIPQMLPWIIYTATFWTLVHLDESFRSKGSFIHSGISV